jgi:hypothetical protein
MKKPTTPWAKMVQEKAQINRDFLISQGWRLKEEKPLFETFTHTKNPDAFCSIGLYGEFSLTKVHWCNKTPELFFNTVNPDLTTDDYFSILRMLRIRLNTDLNDEVSDTTGDDSSTKAK